MGASADDKMKVFMGPLCIVLISIQLLSFSSGYTTSSRSSSDEPDDVIVDIPEDEETALPEDRSILWCAIYCQHHCSAGRGCSIWYYGITIRCCNKVETTTTTTTTTGSTT